MTAAREDVQQINDAFAVMQRAAKGKAKATTETATATESEPEQLPWYVTSTRLLVCSRTHVGQGRKVQAENARRGRIPQRHHQHK